MDTSEHNKRYVKSASDKWRRVSTINAHVVDGEIDANEDLIAWAESLISSVFFVAGTGEAWLDSAREWQKAVDTQRLEELQRRATHTQRQDIANALEKKLAAQAQDMIADAILKSVGK